MQSRRAVSDGAARGRDQPAVTDETMVDAVIDGELARHTRLFEACGQKVAVVEQRVEAADDQMRRRQARRVGEDWRRAPVAVLLRPFEIGLPDPAHLGLRQARAASEALPRCALGVGRVATVDQQLKAKGAVAGVTQGEGGRKRQVGAG